MVLGIILTNRKLEYILKAIKSLKIKGTSSKDF